MKVKGLDKLIKDLHKLGAVGVQAIADVTEFTARDIERDAKILAPVNKRDTGGDLRQGIQHQEIDRFHYRVVAHQKYSAYQEFGTGGLVEVPQELYDIAIQFKGKGIRQVNIPPRAFLYPAFVKGRNQYYNDLKDELDRLTNDI